jgi:hypothetical protein
MPFQFPTPQGLECMATAIQGFSFGRTRPFAAQITPLDFVGRYTGIFIHLLAFVSSFDIRILSIT